MKIVIFGASGKTGRLLVEQGLAAGHIVTAFVRDLAKLPQRHERLRLVQGDIYVAASVDSAIAGQEAVICALGPQKGGPKDIMAVSAYHILHGMEKCGVRRLVTILGAGVGDPNDQPGLIDKAIKALIRLFAHEAWEASLRHAASVRASETDWVLVRVPMLTDTAREALAEVSSDKGRIRIGYLGTGAGNRICREDLAAFVLQQLEDDTYLHKAPVISN